MISRVQGDGLVDESEIALDLFELMSHRFESAQQFGLFIALRLETKKALESSLDNRGLGRSLAPGRSL